VPRGQGSYQGLFGDGRGVPADPSFRHLFLRNEAISGNPSLNALPGDPGDVHVHGHRGRGAAPSAAGGLEALKLVQGFV
jgi:hypothetical protein